MEDIRNPEGIWINSELFREAGNYFMKNKYYNPDPWGSPAWYEFWEEERKRCLFGYSVGGAKITGDHYFYLNYTPIQKVDVHNARGNKSSKIEGFPDFWDGDYNYFWIREIARHGIMDCLNIPLEKQNEILLLEDKEKLKKLLEYYNTLKLLYSPNPSCLEGGKDLIIGKSRRRGFSYKNASIATKNLFHIYKSYTMFMAYEKKYLYPGIKTVFGKCQLYINFLNANTGWRTPSDYINNASHIKASYKQYKNGIEVEGGLLSEIEAISFKDNPSAGRGADTYDIFGEEVGAWGVPGGLKNTIAAMRSSSEAGLFKTGMMTLYGTSGELESGTVDFADLFKRPNSNGFMSFYDIWGDIKEKEEGFFFPKHLNTEGFYDRQGNSNLNEAKNFELNVRKNLIKNGATSTEIRQRMQEEPLNSSEAFAMISRNSFPVVELQKQLDKIEAKKLYITKATPVKFYREKGIAYAKPILGDITPINSYKDIPIDLRSCPVIYEFPAKNPPRGLYKIGYDPIRQDTGTSLIGIVVYKSVEKGSYTHDIIVAEYIGRMEDPDDNDEIAEYFAEIFNTTIMYENECTGTKNYFRRKKRLSLLAAQPDSVISKNIKKSGVNRIYGCHMTVQLKEAGERYIKTWLTTILDYDEEGNPITVIDRIYSRRLLEELIAYFREGNFDLISALIMCLFQVQEEALNTEYDENKVDSRISQLESIIKNLKWN